MPQAISNKTTNKSVELIESTLEVKLQENQTGDANQFLGSYILSYCMYMFVSDLLILKQSNKASQCLRLFTRQLGPLMKG